jgi:hypothetical protein
VIAERPSPARLLEMADELVGTDDLIAIYIPQGTENVYDSEEMHGRVVGAVRLVEKPKDKRIEDYFHTDWDGTLRWPIGWPCEIVYRPPVKECPVFRGRVERVFGDNIFGAYVARFQHGPFRLEKKMADHLTEEFTKFTRLA